MPKFAGESCAGIWELPKELSGLDGRGWNELKTDGGGWKGGGWDINGPESGGGGNGRGDRREERLLLLLFVGPGLSLNLFHRFLMAYSCPCRPGTCFIRSLAGTFFQHQVLWAVNKLLDFLNQR